MLCTMALHHVLLPQKTKNKHFLSYSGGRAHLLCPPAFALPASPSEPRGRHKDAPRGTAAWQPGLCYWCVSKT